MMCAQTEPTQTGVSEIHNNVIGTYMGICLLVLIIHTPKLPHLWRPAVTAVI